MSGGKIIGYIVAAILIFFGVLFVWAAFSPEGEGGWILVGVISVAIGLGIIALIKFREPKPAQAPQEIIQKIDLSGDIELETLNAVVSCKRIVSASKRERSLSTVLIVAPRIRWLRNQSGKVERST